MRKQFLLSTVCGAALLVGCGTKVAPSNVQPDKPVGPPTAVTTQTPTTTPTPAATHPSILDTIPPAPKNKNFSYGRRIPAEINPQNNVVLTFDDGPSPWTGQLVQTLDHENVPAVFFWNTYHIQYANSSVVDMLQNSPNISVGDHTVDHPNLLNLGYSGQYKEINDDKMAVQQLIGRPVYFFRPPFGNYNSTTEQVLYNTNLTNVMWDDDSLDWKYNANETAILRTIQSEIHPGAVILMHDHEHTIQFLPDIIAMIRRDGYGFTTFQTPTTVHPPTPLVTPVTPIVHSQPVIQAPTPPAPHPKTTEKSTSPVAADQHQVEAPKSPTK